MQVHNVLVPVDFSAPSLGALEFALPLIKHFGADLHLVHVFATDHPFTGLVGMPFVLPELETGRSIHEQLKDVAKKYSIALRPENLHVMQGRAFEEICRLGRDTGIDLIVIATRGNTGLKHLALGSTAERVVRYSSCPVLVTHGAKPSGGLPGFREILAPLDFSECSMQGLAYAKAFARHFKSKITLLNSVHFPYYVASDEYARYDLPRLMQHAEIFARDQMRDLFEKTDWNGLEVETSLQTGHPGQEICEHARDSDVDLIVISTHGSTGLTHLLLGSVAEYVVRHAHCPVLVVPARLSEIQTDPAKLK
ncbi:MAG TPA: universal stress protein [Candidatus Udaeobacter sp.]|nr:universal stress protein [Candidatus Udaeobacter sp.]